MVSGDCEGNIRIYDVGNGVRSKDLPNGSKELLPPRRVSVTITEAEQLLFHPPHLLLSLSFQTLSHSQSTSIIRDVSFSHNMEYLVSVDASNRVYIWKATTPI